MDNYNKTSVSFICLVPAMGGLLSGTLSYTHNPDMHGTYPDFFIPF